MPRSALHERPGPTAPSAAVTTRRDGELSIVTTEREALVLRHGRPLALGVVSERECCEPPLYELPLLIRFAEVWDAGFAEDLARTREVRSGRGEGRELRAKGWKAEPVSLEFADGSRREILVLPPFEAFACPACDCSYLMKEVDAATTQE